jgi:hypothetical protein
MAVPSRSKRKSYSTSGSRTVLRGTLCVRTPICVNPDAPVGRADEASAPTPLLLPSRLTACIVPRSQGTIIGCPACFRLKLLSRKRCVGIEQVNNRGFQHPRRSGSIAGQWIYWNRWMAFNTPVSAGGRPIGAFSSETESGAYIGNYDEYLQSGKLSASP